MGVEKTLVLGRGASGRAVASYLRSLNEAVDSFAESDGDWPGAAGLLNAGYREAVISPGFRADHPWRHDLARAGIPSIGECGWAAARWNGLLYGVTGTNGKSTITRFWAEALRGLDWIAVEGGNLGDPLTSFLRFGRRVLAEAPRRELAAVCEISSFQAHDWGQAPLDGVLWSNFDGDHLDWHGSMQEYFRAKRVLLERVDSDGFALVGPTVAEWSRRLRLPLPPATRVVGYDLRPRLEPPPDSALGQAFFRENFDMVAAAWEWLGHDPNVLIEAARRFILAPHRISPVARRGALKIINDSKATNFHAALAALRTADGPVWWIGGGSDKGVPLEDFAKEVGARIKGAFLIGETAPALADLLSAKVAVVHVCNDIEAAVQAALAAAGDSGTLLLSPGFASFDQFSGYAERGQRFCQAVFSSLSSPSP